LSQIVHFFDFGTNTMFGTECWHRYAKHFFRLTIILNQNCLLRTAYYCR